MEEFKRLADSPTSIKHGVDMADLIESASVLSKKAADQIAAGRFADAQRNFETYAAMADKIRDKAREAAQFQDDRAAVVEKTSKDTASTVWMWLITGSLFAIAAAIFGGVVLTRSIARPLADVVVQLDYIAGGDVSRDVAVEYVERGDEIGLLAKAMQAMSVSLRVMSSRASPGGSSVLSSSSAELTANSTQMSDGSHQASTRAHAVAAAAEQMTTNVVSVAAGMEQTTTNLSSVASATEQMTATIGEIASNSEKARASPNRPPAKPLISVNR